MRAWHHCHLTPQGRVISWETAVLDIKHLNMSHLDRRETCLNTSQDKNHIVAFNLLRSFPEARRLCQNIGGEIAVASDQNSSEIMTRECEQNCKANVYSTWFRMPTKFYNGVIRDDHGNIVNVVSGESTKEWYSDKPLLQSQDDSLLTPHSRACITQSTANHMWRFSQCTERYSPICQMGNARKLFLEGVCSHSRVDRDFVMKSQTEFLGYILTSMVYSVSNSRWDYSVYRVYSVYSV